MMPRTMNSLMEDLFFNGQNKFSNDASLFQVPVNITETDNAYNLHVIAPGLKKEDFNVNVDKNLLSISFEQKEENKETDTAGKVLRSEYKMRSFERSFTLSEKTDASKISAQYVNGVLEVSIPKKEVSEPTKQVIAVN